MAGVSPAGSSHDLRRVWANALLVEQEVHPGAVLRLGGREAFQRIESSLDRSRDSTVAARLEIGIRLDSSLQAEQAECEGSYGNRGFP